MNALKTIDILNGPDSLSSSPINAQWMGDEEKYESLETLNVFKQYDQQTFATRRLFGIMQKLKNGEDVKIVSFGGSPTAMRNYVKRVADFFSAFDGSGKVIHVQMGHGHRNSFHVAYLMDSLLIENPDIVLWEFSINDVYFSPKHIFNFSPSRRHEDYPLRTFLKMVQNAPGITPLVVLGLLWPNPENYYGLETIEKYMEAGAAYSNVLGYVNLGNYRSSLADLNERNRLTISDMMHPSELGARYFSDLFIMLLAQSLLNSSPDTLDLFPEILTDSSADFLPVACEEESVKQSTLYNRYFKYMLESKSYPTSWTADAPIAGSTTMKLQDSEKHRRISSAKSSKGRTDRRNIIHVPQCSSTTHGLVFKFEPSETYRQYVVMSGEFYLGDNSKSLSRGSWKIKLESMDGQSMEMVNRKDGVKNTHDGTVVNATMHSRLPCAYWIQSEYLLEVNLNFKLNKVSLCMDQTSTDMEGTGGIQLLSLI